jgi:hypothetical protein
MMRESENMREEAEFRIVPRYSPPLSVDTPLPPCFDALPHQAAEGAHQAQTDAQSAVEIKLGRSSHVALVDSRDEGRVRQFRWQLKVRKNAPGQFYAHRTYMVDGRKANVSLHAFIMNAAPGQLVDHENGKGLDNRRSNLRFATHRENATNVTSSKRQKLGGYKGVTWNKAASKWQASICGGEIKSNGKRRQLYLGVFTDPVAAARAYDAKALEVFGPFASLNFENEEAQSFATALGEAAEAGLRGVLP